MAMNVGGLQPHREDLINEFADPGPDEMRQHQRRGFALGCKRRRLRRCDVSVLIAVDEAVNFLKTQ
jgi:hypothetical protein